MVKEPWHRSDGMGDGRRGGIGAMSWALMFDKHHWAEIVMCHCCLASDRASGSGCKTHTMRRDMAFNSASRACDTLACNCRSDSAWCINVLMTATAFSAVAWAIVSCLSKMRATVSEACATVKDSNVRLPNVTSKRT